MGSAQSPRRSRCAGLRADGVSGARQPLQEGVWMSTHEGQGSGKAGVGVVSGRSWSRPRRTEGRSSRWAFRGDNSA